jgi:subtilisin family serine protease
VRSRFVPAVLAAAFAISALPAAALAAPDLGSPVAVAAGDVLQPSLRDRLALSSPTEALRVMVTAADVDRAFAAVQAAGLQPELTLDRIGVAVAVGTPAAITALRSDRRVVRVDWADEPAQYFLETSHTATRGDQVRDGAFDLDGDRAGDRLDGAGVGIAIVDSGVDGTHPMFAGPDGSKVKVNVKGVCSDAAPILYGIVEPDTRTAYSQFSACFVDMTAINDTDAPSIGGHGTHVAGIAGGYEVTDGAGRRLSGAAPGAPLYSVSTGATISVYSGSLGLYWVLENHADPCGDGSCPPIKVVNNSWGTSGAFSASSPHAQIQRLLVEEGVTVVWAAGNDGGTGSADNVNPFSKDPTPGGPVGRQLRRRRQRQPRQRTGLEFVAGAGRQRRDLPRPRRAGDEHHRRLPGLAADLRHRVRHRRPRLQHDLGHVDGRPAHRRHRRRAPAGRAGNAGP